MIVTPFEWGSTSGYDFLNNDNPAADIVYNYHVSWSLSDVVFERSFRIWEPGRMAMSSLGVIDPSPDQPFNVPQVPQGATIHGIKGSMLIMPQRVAVFYNADTGEELVEQPSYDDIFAPGSGEDLPGYPVNSVVDPQMFSRYPVFVTMYKGTYNPYGGTNFEGGNIDSGPTDDPDTLLGVDITNPTVLEQSRIVWWDMELCTAAHRSRVRRAVIRTETDPDEIIDYWGLEPYRTHLTKYNLSLERNWKCDDEQVLWLHIAPGIVKTPLFVTQPGGVLAPVAYRVAMNCELVASMMVTPWTPGK